MNIRYFIALLVLIILVVGAVFLMRTPAAAPTQESSGPTPVATAHYACDNGKSIDASFFEGTSTVQAQPGEIPVPTGTADVSLDGGAAMTLHQTISADGVRYANDDESFVFWNKGNEALIMRDNSMDLDYTNCAVASAS